MQGHDRYVIGAVPAACMICCTRTGYAKDSFVRAREGGKGATCPPRQIFDNEIKRSPNVDRYIMIIFI